MFDRRTGVDQDQVRIIVLQCGDWRKKKSKRERREEINASLTATCISCAV